MRKKLLSWLLVVALVITMLPGSAFAAGTGIDYIGADGKIATISTTEDINSNTTFKGGADKWYVAEVDVTIVNDITSSDIVNIILTDGCKLTIKGQFSAKGLNVYGQKGNTGVMNVTPNAGNAISLTSAEDVATDMKVYGGKVIGKSNDATGISLEKGDLTVAVNGQVEGHGASTGIKVNNSYKTSNTEIIYKGGALNVSDEGTVIGNADGTGISVSRYLNVTGGSVTGTANSSEGMEGIYVDGSTFRDASNDISRGTYVSGGDVTGEGVSTGISSVVGFDINGGTVTGTATDTDSIGICTSYGNIDVSGGQVTGISNNGTGVQVYGELTLKGNAANLTGKGATAISAGSIDDITSTGTLSNECIGNFVITGDEDITIGDRYIPKDINVGDSVDRILIGKKHLGKQFSNEKWGILKVVKTKDLTETPITSFAENGTYKVTFTNGLTDLSAEFVVPGAGVKQVSYIDKDGKPATVINPEVIKNDTTFAGGADKWYVAEGNVTIDKDVTSGNIVNIILTNNSTLTINGYLKASTLNIYGQTGNTGVLNITSGYNTTVDIQDNMSVYGGQVNATGGDIGVQVHLGDLTVKNRATLSGTGAAYGIKVKTEPKDTLIEPQIENGQNINVNNATLKGNDKSNGECGIYANRNIKATKAVIIGNANGQYAYGIEANEGSLSATDSNISGTGVKAGITVGNGVSDMSSQIIINGGKLSGMISRGNEGAGIFADASEMIITNGATVNATGADYGIALYTHNSSYVGKNFTITDSTVTATATNISKNDQSKYSGIYLSDGDFVADGRSSITATGSNYGINVAKGTLTNNGTSTITATADGETGTSNDGIFVNSSLTVTGGSVTGNSSFFKGIAIHDGDLTVSGGAKVEGTGKAYGIYAEKNKDRSKGNIAVSDNSTVIGKGNVYSSISADGNFTVNSSTVTGESNGDGYGIYVSKNATITDSNVTGTTKSTGRSGINVSNILTLKQNAGNKCTLTANGTASLRVESIADESKGTLIGDGKFIITGDEVLSANNIRIPKDIKVGDSVDRITIGKTYLGKEFISQSWGDPNVYDTNNISGGNIRQFDKFGTYKVVFANNGTDISKEFTIAGKVPTITFKDKKVTYDGNPIDITDMFEIDLKAGTPTYTIEKLGTNGEGSIEELESGDPCVNVTKAGIFKIKVTTEATTTHSSATATATLTVEKRNRAGVSLTDSKKYGQECQFNLTDKLTGLTNPNLSVETITNEDALDKTAPHTAGYVIAGNKLTAYLANNKVNADKTVTIPVKVTSDFDKDFKITVKVTILDKSAQDPLTIAGGNTFTYGDAINLTVNGGSGTGDVTYAITNNSGVVTVPASNVVTDGKITLTSNKVGKFDIQVTKAEDADYAEAQSTVYTITVTPADCTGKPDFEPVTTTGVMLNTVKLKDTNMNPKGGTFTWNVTDPSKEEVKAGVSYKWTYTPAKADQGNYNVLTGSVVLYTPAPTPVGPVKPVKPFIPNSENIKPKEPTIPEEGFTIGMDKEQQTKADEVIKNMIEEIFKPSGDQPVPESPSEKETEGTKDQIKNINKYSDKLKIEIKTDILDDKNLSPEMQKKLDAFQETLNNAFENMNVEILDMAGIDVSAKTEDYSNTKELGKLNGFDEKLGFTIKHAENLDFENIGIAVIKDGKVQIIPAEDLVYDRENNTIVFSTSDMATIAIFACQEKVAPEKVQNVKVKTDNGLFKVSFDKATDADAYKIYVRQAGKDWRWYRTVNDNLLIKKLYKKPLVKNGKYQVKVVAMNEVGLGEASKIKTVYANRIGTKSAVMYAPTFVKVETVKGTIKVVAKKVYVKNPPKGLQYKLSYKLKGAENWKSAGYSAKNVKSIKGLKKSKVYNLALRYRYKSSLDGKTYVYSKARYTNATIR